MPERVQLSRAKGWRMPPDTVVVSRPTKWGNPFAAGSRVQYLNGEIIVQDAAHAVRLFRAHWCKPDGALAASARHALAGKNLACWCKPGSPCHADVLLELANR